MLAIKRTSVYRTILTSPLKYVIAGFNCIWSAAGKRKRKRENEKKMKKKKKEREKRRKKKWKRKDKIYDGEKNSLLLKRSPLR